MHFPVMHFILVICATAQSTNHAWNSLKIQKTLPLRPSVGSTLLYDKGAIHYLPQQLHKSIRRMNRWIPSMTLVPIRPSDLKRIVPRGVTTEQWKSYWGFNRIDKLQKIMESFLMSYGGAWLAWFLSFMAGSFVSSIVGSLMIFNWIYAPLVVAARMNKYLWQTDNGHRTFHGYFCGKISSLKKVKRRSGKTVGGLSQEYLLVTIKDETERELEIVANWQDTYHSLKKNMECQTLLVSSRDNFADVILVTEIFVPQGKIWIGDYPYLNRNQFKRFASQAAKILKSQSSSFSSEASSEWPSDDYSEDGSSEMEENIVDIEVLDSTQNMGFSDMDEVKIASKAKSSGPVDSDARLSPGKTFKIK